MSTFTYIRETFFRPYPNMTFKVYVKNLTSDYFEPITRLFEKYFTPKCEHASIDIFELSSIALIKVSVANESRREHNASIDFDSQIERPRHLNVLSLFSEHYTSMLVGRIDEKCN